MADGGAERIGAAFARAGEQGRAALMPYMMGGYPDLETSLAVARVYRDAGADVVELGVPFSDPLADGPVIHAAATVALDAGAGLDDVLAIAAEIGADVPVVLMVYANMVVNRDPGELASALERSHVAGAIVPDLPPEEAGELRSALGARGIAFVPLVAPTTPPARRARIAADAEGFVYVVSDTSTTGERDALPRELGELVAAVKGDASVPVAVGFGISTPEQAAQVGEMADGVIVGTRLVRAVGEAGPDAAGEFIGQALAAMSGGASG